MKEQKEVKKVKEKREQVLVKVWLSPEEFEVVKAAAAEVGKSVSLVAYEALLDGVGVKRGG